MRDDFIDYYTLLGVGIDADDHEIDRAYRRKVKEVHPDKHDNDAASVERTKVLNEARDTLKDAAKRKEYHTRWLAHHLAQRRPAETAARPKASPTARPPVHRPAPTETKPTIWRSPPTNPPSTASTVSGSVGLGAALGFMGLLLGGAYLASKANAYDRRVERYRGRDGTFRSGRFS